MIEVVQEDDGSLTVHWDENDPIESQLNTWTEQDFIDAIMDKCKGLEELGNEQKTTLRKCYKHFYTEIHYNFS